MRSTNDNFLFQGGSDQPGPACMRLLSMLKAIQQGKAEDKFGWLDIVQEAKENSFVGNGDSLDNTKTNGVVASVDKLP